MTRHDDLVPLLGPGSTAAPDRRLRTRLQAVREEAGTLLARTAEESGPDSRLHRLCVELWLGREADARASLRYGDLANAVLILERAVELLTLGPSVVARKELELDGLEILLQTT